MQEINIIFGIAILIMSVVIHEISHGYTAYILGDPTAKESGRLTINPLKHLDFYGSFLVPVLTFLLGGFILGWAKPVPYNPYNLRNQKQGSALVALAGPMSNFLVAVIFGLAVRQASLFAFLPVSFFQIAILIVIINLSLGIFNCIPIPPLDGSKILFGFLPSRWQNFEIAMESFGFLLLIVFIFFFYQLLIPLVFFLFKIITGLTL